MEWVSCAAGKNTINSPQGNTKIPKPPQPAERTYYLDNLKSALTALVIYHHTAIPYGGDGASVYQSSFHRPASSPTLIGFNAINQSFFMGTFFFISGYFTKKTLQRKTPDELVRARLYRLGLPAVIYTIIGPPVCSMIVGLSQGQQPSLDSVGQYWQGVKGIRGPVWYIAILLLFDTVYAEASRVQKTGDAQTRVPCPLGSQEPQTMTLIFSLSLCAGASFISRLFFPVDQVFVPLNIRLGYLPQYVGAYYLGTQVDSPASAIPTMRQKILLGAVSAVSGAAVIRYLAAGDGGLQQLKGGLNAAALGYAIRNDFTGYLLAGLLLATFRQFASCPLTKYISGNAYGAFLLHIPVSTLIEVCTDRWEASGVTKTIVIGTVNVLLSWSLSYCCGLLQTLELAIWKLVDLGHK